MSCRIILLSPFAFKDLPGHGEENIHWLPIVLSPSFDGFSVLMPLENPDANQRAEYERYLSILKTTIARMDAGTYVNPIDEVIARQGMERLSSRFMGGPLIFKTRAVLALL